MEYVGWPLERSALPYFCIRIRDKIKYDLSRSSNVGIRCQSEETI